MDKSSNSKSVMPPISEPTPEEIEDIIEKFDKKHSKILSITDATKIIQLTKELNKWNTIEKEYESGQAITEDAVKEIQELISKNRGEDVSFERASLEAEKSLIMVMMTEKERIDGEIRGIIERYKMESSEK